MAYEDEPNDDAGHVLFYSRPDKPRLRDRLADRPGTWTLLTRDDYDRQFYCPALAELDGPLMPPADLAGWAEAKLGYPVTLEEDPPVAERPDWVDVLYGVRGR
jgi:hypothetical protein